MDPTEPHPTTVPRGRYQRRKARAGLPFPGPEAGVMYHFKNRAAKQGFIRDQRALPDDTPEAEIPILLEALVQKYCSPVMLFRGIQADVRRDARSYWRKHGEADVNLPPHTYTDEQLAAMPEGDRERVRKAIAKREMRRLKKLAAAKAAVLFDEAPSVL